MLAKRIIPTILVRGKTAYKGERFVSTRSIGSALAIAQVHARRGVDELCILDISATEEGRGPDLDLVRELSDSCYIPITVGGGVKSLKDIDDLLRAGADKVAIGAAGRTGVQLIDEATGRFGRQAIVQIVDVWPGQLWEWNENAGEIMLQSPMRDGTMEGYDLAPLRSLVAQFDGPVIISGGCSGYEDMLSAFKAGADACAAGALFAFTEATPKGAARYLQKQGMEVRCN
jgi:cyclase